MPLPSPLTLAATNAATTAASSCWSAIRHSAHHAARLAPKGGARATVPAAMCAAFSTNLYGVIDTATTVPEPGSWALAGVALLGLAAARRRRRACGV